MTFNVITIDLNGGTNTAPVTLSFSSPLPVTLVSFTAEAAQQSAVLKWATASELNNDYFAVERSLDGRAFTQLGQVRGQGNKAAATAYTYTDTGIGQQAMGPVYYRLRQIDLDGTSTYSPVRSVRFAAAAPVIGLYPNPATTTILDLTRLPAGTYQVSVLDATGHVVLQQAIEAGITQSLPLTTVATGSYTVVVSNTGLHLTARLIRN